MLEVDHRLGLAGRAGAVEPEGHIVPSRGGGVDLLVGSDLVGAQDLRLVGRASGRGGQLLRRVGVDDDHPRQAVLDVVVVVLGALEQGVDRDGDGADADGPEEGGDPPWGVVARDEHALFAPDS